MNPSSFEDHVYTLQDESPFECTFSPHSLVVVGTKDADGEYNLAPKHMITPIGEDHFGFVCSSEHHTADNIRRLEEFTVSYPRPEQILSISLSAEPRDQTGHKPDLKQLETVQAPNTDAVFIQSSYLFLECTLQEVVTLPEEILFFIGAITDKHAHQDALRSTEQDDADLLHDNPLLAYLHPGRYASIQESNAFPFPQDFHH